MKRVRKSLWGSFLGILSLFAGVGHAQTTLSLPIPERDRLPRERISLTIQLPEKVEKIERPPAIQPRTRNPLFDSYRFRASRPIPRRRFVFQVLDRLDKVGVRPGLSARRMRKRRVNEVTIIGRAAWEYYAKLEDIYRKDAIHRFPLEPLDIERLRQVLDIFSDFLVSEHYPVLEADRTLTKIIEAMQEVRGQNTIKIVELKESGEGKMVLELEVRREGHKGWP